MKKKIVSAVLCAAVCLGMLAGCGQSSTSGEIPDSKKEDSKTAAEKSGGTAAKKSSKLDVKLDKDKLVVAPIIDYEPFSFKEDGEWKGYNIDIWKEFEKRTGIPVEWYEPDSEIMEKWSSDASMSYPQLVMIEGMLDVDVYTWEISPSAFEEADDTIEQTEPIYYSGITLAVAADDSIQEMTNISGEVDVNAGEEMHAFDIEETLKNVNSKICVWEWTGVYGYDKLSQLKAGDPPLALLDIEAKYAMKKDKGLNIRLLEPVGYAVGCPRVFEKNTADAVNIFLQSIKEDGTLKEISEKWFGQDVSVERK